ncbi:9254_t:CDS:2, partial [Scutellospora calospora]
MPTLRREDCVSAGSGGDKGDVECEAGLDPEPALVWALRWKNEWIGGWYWRLRVCSADDRAMMFMYECGVAGFSRTMNVGTPTTSERTLVDYDNTLEIPRKTRDTHVECERDIPTSYHHAAIWSPKTVETVEPPEVTETWQRTVSNVQSIGFRPHDYNVSNRSAVNGTHSLFLKLPAEIRTRIYEYALGGNVIHVRRPEEYIEDGSV